MLETRNGPKGLNAMTSYNESPSTSQSTGWCRHGAGCHRPGCRATVFSDGREKRPGDMGARPGKRPAGATNLVSQITTPRPPRRRFVSSASGGSSRSAETLASAALRAARRVTAGAKPRDFSSFSRPPSSESASGSCTSPALLQRRLPRSATWRSLRSSRSSRGRRERAASPPAHPV